MGKLRVKSGKPTSAPYDVDKAILSQASGRDQPRLDTGTYAGRCRGQAANIPSDKQLPSARHPNGDGEMVHASVKAEELHVLGHARTYGVTDGWYPDGYQHVVHGERCTDGSDDEPDQRQYPASTGGPRGVSRVANGVNSGKPTAHQCHGNPEPSQPNGMKVGWKVQSTEGEQPSNKPSPAPRNSAGRVDDMCLAPGKPGDQQVGSVARRSRPAVLRMVSKPHSPHSRWRCERSRFQRRLQPHRALVGRRCCDRKCSRERAGLLPIDLANGGAASRWSLCSVSCIENRVNCRGTYGATVRYGNPQLSRANGIKVARKVQRSSLEQPSDKSDTSARHLPLAGDDMIQATVKAVGLALVLRCRFEKQYRQHADVVFSRGSKFSAGRLAPSARTKPTSSSETPRGQRCAEPAGNSAQGLETYVQPQQVVLAAKRGVCAGATPRRLNGRDATERTSAQSVRHGIVRSSEQSGTMMSGRHQRRYGRRDRSHSLAEQWIRWALRDIAPQLRGPRGVSRVANRVNCGNPTARGCYGNPQPSCVNGIGVTQKAQRLGSEQPSNKLPTSARHLHRDDEIVQAPAKAREALRKSNSDPASPEHHLRSAHFCASECWSGERVRYHRAEPRHVVAPRQLERNRRDVEGSYLVRGPGSVSCQVHRVNCRETYGAMVRYGNPQPSQLNGIEVGWKVQRLDDEQPSDKSSTSARHLFFADEDIVHIRVKARGMCRIRRSTSGMTQAVVKPTSNGETPPGRSRAELAGNSEQGVETGARPYGAQRRARAGAAPVALNGGGAQRARQGIVRSSRQLENLNAVQPRRSVAVQPWQAAWA